MNYHHLKFFKHESREKRLEKLKGKKKFFYDFPLSKALKLQRNDYDDLCSVCNLYLWESLRGSFRNKHFTLNKNLFYNYLQDILNLPNKTPNGMIVPYFENFKSYNLVHDILSQILIKNNFVKHFSDIQTSFKIRVISNKISKKNLTRDKSSFKVHSDVWASEPISHLLINIPVLGNSKEIGLRFFHPDQDLSNFNVRLDNFSEANDLFKNIKPYNMKFSKGLIFLSDAFALHQTFISPNALKKKIDGRLSIDIRATYKTLLPEEKNIKTFKTPETYIPINDWKKLSTNKILVNTFRINSFLKKKEKKHVKREKVELEFYEYSKS